MQYKKLGNTGISVSTISLGTVSLGVDYGIEIPGNFGRPENLEVIRLLSEAADAGITLFDTAPNYGTSEMCIGEALSDRSECYIATKISIPYAPGGRELLKGVDLSASVETSLENSLKNLQRDTLDIVQIHNATVPVIRNGTLTEHLIKAKEEGRVRLIGASVYTEEEALAVIQAGCFDVVQVAYSLLDQRMADRVFPSAKSAGVGIITRSALLKGILTCKSEWLPPELSPLKSAATVSRDILAGGRWENLPQMAIRFCMSSSDVGSVLVGIRTKDELQDALAVAEAGPLPVPLMQEAKRLALQDGVLLNPSNWPVK
jgi:aryl-alcohol dehydrogenase-like predicted oxidoreductase